MISRKHYRDKKEIELKMTWSTLFSCSFVRNMKGMSRTGNNCRIENLFGQASILSFSYLAFFFIISSVLYPRVVHFDILTF